MKAFNIVPVGKKGPKEPEKKKDPKLKCSVSSTFIYAMSVDL